MQVCLLERANDRFAVFGWIISVLNTQIDMETTLRQTSVAIGRIYASRSGDAALNGR